MTIEEKAKAYDEALKLAKDYHEDKNCFEYLKGVLENLFPELAESEDERIRKAIINTIEDCSPILSPEVQKRMIAWLEKQASKPEWSEEDEDNLNLAIYHIRCDDIPYSPHDVEPIVDWLNSIKQRLGGDDYERK